MAAGQPETYSASGAVIARVNEIVDGVAPGTIAADTLIWWRSAWAVAVPNKQQRTNIAAGALSERSWDDAVDSLVTRVGVEGRAHIARHQMFKWFRGATLTGDVLSVEPSSMEWVAFKYLPDMEATHGRPLQLVAATP